MINQFKKQTSSYLLDDGDDVVAVSPSKLGSNNINL